MLPSNITYDCEIVERVKRMCMNESANELSFEGTKLRFRIKNEKYDSFGKFFQ